MGAFNFPGSHFSGWMAMHRIPLSALTCAVKWGQHSPDHPVFHSLFGVYIALWGGVPSSTRLRKQSSAPRKHQKQIPSNPRFSPKVPSSRCDKWAHRGPILTTFQRSCENVFSMLFQRFEFLGPGGRSPHQRTLQNNEKIAFKLPRGHRFSRSSRCPRI